MTGRPFSSSTEVLVALPGGEDPVALYVDRDRSGPADNPLTIGVDGNVEVYAEPGTYDLLVAGGRLQVAVRPDPVDVGPTPLVGSHSWGAVPDGPIPALSNGPGWAGALGLIDASTFSPGIAQTAMAAGGVLRVRAGQGVARTIVAYGGIPFPLLDQFTVGARFAGYADASVPEEADAPSKMTLIATDENGEGYICQTRTYYDLGEGALVSYVSLGRDVGGLPVLDTSWLLPRVLTDGDEVTMTTRLGSPNVIEARWNGRFLGELLDDQYDPRSFVAAGSPLDSSDVTGDRWRPGVRRFWVCTRP